MNYRKIIKALSLAGLAGFVVAIASTSAAYLAQRNNHNETEREKLLIDGLCGTISFFIVFFVALGLLLRKQRTFVNNDNPYTIISTEPYKEVAPSNPINIPRSVRFPVSTDSSEEEVGEDWQERTVVRENGQGRDIRREKDWADEYNQSENESESYIFP